MAPANSITPNPPFPNMQGALILVFPFSERNDKDHKSAIFDFRSHICRCS